MTEFKTKTHQPPTTSEHESSKYKYRQIVEQQEIRERKERKKSTHGREPNIQNANNVNNNPNNQGRYLDRFFRQPRTTKLGVIGAILLLFILALTYLYPLPERSSSPLLRDFTHKTTDVFDEINSVDLPASEILTQHRVAARNVANMIQHSPAFSNHGSQIASGLRDFSEKISVAGRNLQSMYNKGSNVYIAFDKEMESMMERLKSGQKKGNARFFKTRLNALIAKVKEFRQIVEKTQSSMQNAEEIRHDTEGYIIDGSREAEKFINDNEQHAVDITKTKNELAHVNDMLRHLGTTAGHLEKMRNILISYEDKLLDVEAELGNSGNDEDIFDITKEDLKYLGHAVNNLKNSHNKFRSLSN